MPKFLTHALIGIIGSLIGFYACILIRKYSSLTLVPQVSFEINPFEIFSILVNIFIAFIVARSITKQNDLEKTEKEILISLFQNFKETFLTKIEEILRQSDFETPLTKTTFKTLRKRLDSLVKLSEENKFIEETDVISRDLKSKVTELWELFTDTPRTAPSKSSVAIKSSIDALRLDKLSQIESKLIEIEKHFFQLVLKINQK